MMRSVRLAGTQLPQISALNTISQLPICSSPGAPQPFHRNASQLLKKQFLGEASHAPFKSVVGVKFQSLELSREAAAGGGRRRSLGTMASGEKNYNAQAQGVQPGLEHQMDPIPKHSPDYTPSNKLKGKVAIITGGDSGIGRAVARLFSLEGASVAITYLPDIEEKDADDTLDIIKKSKVADAKDPIKIGVDLGFDENCKKVIDEVAEHFGTIDILVNNAAEQHMTENFEDIDPKQVERVFRTNIFSQFFLVKYALKHMKEGSSIVNTTSINAYRGNASLIDYTSTKGAIVAFTRGLALHLAPRKIRVNGVAPGPIWTPLIPGTFPDWKIEQFGSEVPMGRAGEPHEVATAFLFLASEDASYFSGQVLHPNGGVPINT